MKLTDTITGFDLTDYPQSFFVGGKCKARDFQRNKLKEE